MSAVQPNEFPGYPPDGNYQKILIVGEPLCGTTTLFNCLTSTTRKPDLFKSPYLDTKSGNEKQICLGIGEAPCQPENSAIRSLEYGDAKAILLSFNLTKDKSLTSLEETWYPEVRQCNPSVPVFLIGIKSGDGDVSVLQEQAEAVAGKIGAVKYFSCTAENVEAVVPELMKAVAEAVAPAIGTVCSKCCHCAMKSIRPTA